MGDMWSRRRFLGRSVATLALMRAGGVFGQQTGSLPVGGPMEPWSAGFLDIHHISTGRGNSVLAIGPDGTSLMIDAGAAGGSTEAMGPARPDESRRPGEWIGRYAPASSEDDAEAGVGLFRSHAFSRGSHGRCFACVAACAGRGVSADRGDGCGGADSRTAADRPGFSGITRIRRRRRMRVR